MSLLLRVAVSSGKAPSKKLVWTVCLTFLITVGTVIPVVAAWMFHFRGFIRAMSGDGPIDEGVLRSELGGMLASPVVLIAGPIGAIAGTIFCVSSVWLLGLMIGRSARGHSK